MAWSIVGVSNSVEVTAASHALVTTGIASLAQGDLLVACISARIASTTPVTLPTGGEWALVGQQNFNNIATNNSAQASATMAYCVRGASNPNLTFTHPTAPSVAIGRIVAYRGNATSSVLNNTMAATTATAQTNCSWTPNTLTTLATDDLVVAMVAGGQEATYSVMTASTTPSVASGATDTTTAPTLNTCIERADANTTTGADTALAIFDAIPNAANTGFWFCTATVSAAHSFVAGSFRILADAVARRQPVVSSEAVHRAANW